MLSIDIRAKRLQDIDDREATWDCRVHRCDDAVDVLLRNRPLLIADDDNRDFSDRRD
jgi:hypothetical protein